MRAIELACTAIVVAYVALRLRGAGSKRDVLVRLVALALAAWVGEDSVIRAYGFYGYAPAWSLFVDRVPLLVVCIWPVVIDSAHGLAKELAPRGGRAARVALLGGAIVLADASLIEPIAVHAGLWSWSADEPRALFDVPLVGVLGWSLFATAAIATRAWLGARASKAAWSFVVALVAPLATHAALVAVWWAVFRWIGAGESSGVPVVVAWITTAWVTTLAWRAGARVALAAVMARAPGAAFFFVLLAVTASGSAPLVAYALAFAPPYLALLARRMADATAPRTGATR